MSGPGLAALGLINALGESIDEVAERLFRGDIGRLREHHLRTTGASVPIGQVHRLADALPAPLQAFDCRNHRLAYAAYLQIAEPLAALRRQFGPDRIGVVLGSSTAGLDATEEAYEIWDRTGELPARFNYRKQHSMGSVAGVIAEAAGLSGPVYTLSTACTSGAKAMISARDLLSLGFCDAVVTGGVDTLCHMTLNGFEALGALSRTTSQPMSRNRTGLNIGEGAALFIMTREGCDINLCGSGESCDAWHMSAPHPEGEGAEACMRTALAEAGLEPHQIGYLNLHGTGTQQNDSMEALAVARVFGRVPCSSTKPLVGHCLGAAGAQEAAFCWISMKRAGRSRNYPLPPHIWDGEADPELPLPDLVTPGRSLPPGSPTYFMSNSFAFGGNNCAVILEHRPENGEAS